jgi:hypothetical protein
MPRNEIDVTRATAHLPGLDIEIIHRQSPDGRSEQVSINLTAAPSFEAFANSFCLLDRGHEARLVAMGRSDPRHDDG